MAFVALEVALELVEGLAEIITLVERRDPNLGGQLRRAVTAVPLNIAEGGERRGRDRLHSFRVASGEAKEARTALRIARGLGYVAPVKLEPSFARLDRLGGLMYGLLRR
jgi:four helix bundle protein